MTLREDAPYSEFICTFTITIGHWTNRMCPPTIFTKKPFQNVNGVSTMSTCLTDHDSIVKSI